MAVGECGLDFYRDLAPRDVQRAVFIDQLDLARASGKPVCVHSREAGGETFALLTEHGGGLRVILHCFSTPEYVELCNERGYFVSFAGNLTYKSSADLRKAAVAVRDDLLLVETDAPFLTPMPYRGHAQPAGLRRLDGPVPGPAARLERRRGGRRHERQRAAGVRHRRSAGRPTVVSAGHARPPARRRYGQHHLVDQGTLGAILAMAGVRPDDVVLEVGAADGLLTERLVEQARFVHAFEIDTRFAPGLDRLAAGRDDLRLYMVDGLRYRLADLDPPPTAVVANLAYNIAVPAVHAHHRGRTERAALGRDASARARRAALREAAHQGLLGRVGAGAALLRARGAAAGAAHGLRAAAAGRFGLRHLHAQRAFCRPAKPAVLETLVRTSFAQRRKQIVNSLSGAAPAPARRDAALTRADVQPPSRRLACPTRPGPRSSRRRSSWPWRGSSRWLPAA